MGTMFIVFFLFHLLKSNEKPNFLFYYPDTIRGEFMSTYGYPLKTTPIIDAFAKTGVVFENHIAQHSQCTPSRVSMMTGRYMHTLGHRTQQHLIRNYENNYLKTLKKAGYTIFMIGKNDMFSVDSLQESVNYWEAKEGESMGKNKFKYGEQGYYSFLFEPSTKNATESNNYKAVARAVEFIQNDPPEPWAVFIPTSGSHPPYSSPKEFYNKFSSQDVKEVYKLRPAFGPHEPSYFSKTQGIPFWRNLTDWDEENFYKIHSIYLGRLNHMDFVFGALLDGLEKSGFADRTVVAMSTDHGDFAGDYRFVEKWPGSLSDTLVHIPLVMRVPEAYGGKKNGRVKVMTQAFDIMETILDVAGIKANWTRFGNSLLPYLAETKQQPTWRKFAYSEGGFLYHNELFPGGTDHVKSKTSLYWPRAEEEMYVGSPKCAMIRNETHKLVYRADGVSELYDLQRDPRELNNVFGESGFSKIQTELLTNLLDWFVRTGDVTPLSTDNRGFPHDNPPPSLQKEL